VVGTNETHVQVMRGRGCRRRKTIYNRDVYSSGISTSPESIPSMTSCGGRPSTVQPTLWAVPRISLTLPARFLERDFGRILRAMSMISSRGTLPECLIFFSFFLSRGGSINGSGQTTGATLGLIGCTLESLDNKGRSGGNNVDFGLSVLDRKLDCHP